MSTNYLAITKQDFLLPATNREAALDAVRLLATECQADDLDTTLRALGWTVRLDAAGNVVAVETWNHASFGIDKYMTDVMDCLERLRAEEVLGALAPYVRAGSWLKVYREADNPVGSGVGTAKCTFDGEHVSIQEP